MARRIRAASVERLLTDQGHEFSEFEGGEWDPGFRVAQAGPRRTHVFYDGPGEADQLAAITDELRAAGYHVVPSQQGRGGRRRLEVTRP
ncbi:hypothetical protein [Streptomyces scabiei]|uniref:hypothetical protein n=1 Tax=Streptomyces scabiei TaxID=1930 RepID=UPI001F09113D|nr:hypothetical protein [Streptomyces scabiei]MDX3026757.1 hypothetical protein [Streptomyces scabiei]MDX3210035.1 hypothetical protein [Streptomyces scabiei]